MDLPGPGWSSPGFYFTATLGTDIFLKTQNSYFSTTSREDRSWGGLALCTTHHRIAHTDVQVGGRWQLGLYHIVRTQAICKATYIGLGPYGARQARGEVRTGRIIFSMVFRSAGDGKVYPVVVKGEACKKGIPLWPSPISNELTSLGFALTF